MLFVRNNKRSSGIDGKTSNCLFWIFSYYRYLWVTFLLATVLWIVKTCDCCFFADFFSVKALLVKKYHIKLLKNVWYILFVLCSLLLILHFPFNLIHTKTFENINVWKKTKPEVDPEPWKKSSGAGATAMKAHSSGARAGGTFMDRGAPEPSCVIFTTAPQPCSCQSIFLK